MTRAEATRLAKAKYGKKAVVQENKQALDPETRAIIRAVYLRLKDNPPKAPPPTPEQLEYHKKYRIWKEQCNQLQGKALGMGRYRIGRIVDSEIIGQYISYDGYGDSWDEAARAANLIGKTDS